MKPYDNQSEKAQYVNQQRKELEATFPMTLAERKALRQWVKDGNDIYANPGCYSSESGTPMNYVEAMRLEKAIREERR